MADSDNGKKIMMSVAAVLAIGGVGLWLAHYYFGIFDSPPAPPVPIEQTITDPAQLEQFKKEQEETQKIIKKSPPRGS
jgi:hypothetical protein